MTSGLSNSPSALYLRNRYERWRAAGLCYGCGKKPQKGFKSCKKCREGQKAWYEANKESCAEVRKRYVTGLKDEVFAAYGGYVCKCCGERRKEFLTLDHVNGGGAKHRRELGRSVGKIYLWIKTNGFPPLFQVLCMNCNFARGLYGYCPHEKERAMKEKYGVEYEKEDGKTKTASKGNSCPGCGTTLKEDRHCENCGTKPFEKRPSTKKEG